ncbi:hypothetical protein UlMin_014675 [Ulmus minor]
MERGLKSKSGRMLIVITIVGWLITRGASETRYKVGGSSGWNQNVNYTQWSSHQQLFVGDWLYFVFDKRYYNVLEVNKTSYENCNEQGFIKNVSRGGRDVFEVREARPYYFISGGGYCYHGMRVAVIVQQPPIPTTISQLLPPPTTSPASYSGALALGPDHVQTYNSSVSRISCPQVLLSLVLVLICQFSTYLWRKIAVCC